MRLCAEASDVPRRHGDRASEDVPATHDACAAGGTLAHFDARPTGSVLIPRDRSPIVLLIIDVEHDDMSVTGSFGENDAVGYAHPAVGYV